MVLNGISSIWEVACQFDLVKVEYQMLSLAQETSQTDNKESINESRKVQIHESIKSRDIYHVLTKVMAGVKKKWGSNFGLMCKLNQSVSQQKSHWFRPVTPPSRVKRIRNKVQLIWKTKLMSGLIRLPFLSAILMLGEPGPPGMLAGADTEVKTWPVVSSRVENMTSQRQKVQRSKVKP